MEGDDAKVLDLTAVGNKSNQINSRLISSNSLTTFNPSFFHVVEGLSGFHGSKGLKST